MRRQPAIWIDFLRRIREDGALGVELGKSGDGGEEEAHVSDSRLDGAVGRHHEHDLRIAGGDSNGERLRRTGEPVSRAGGWTSPARVRRTLEHGAKGKRRRRGESVTLTSGTEDS